MKKQNIPELFGSMVFDDRVMRSCLPADIYQSLRKTIDENARLETEYRLQAIGKKQECYYLPE